MLTIGMLGGIALGCTDIKRLIWPDNSPVPMFAAIRVHVEAAVDRALAGG